MYNPKQFVGKDQGRPEPLRVLVFGAHPDDPDFTAAGVATMYSQAGHQVKMVTVTNGDAGHHAMGGVLLAQRRRNEAREAGACLGVEYVTLDNHDCVLMPTLEIRHQLVRIIREFQPELVLTPRPNDYHPDHRYTSQLVQDAVCIASVPNIVSDVPYLRFTASVVYVWDGFQKPYPFRPDIVVGIDEVVEKKVDALHCHTSQMYEFLPYIKRYSDEVPDDPNQRRAWLRNRLDNELRQIADLYRIRLVELYGEEKGCRIKYAEAFEYCEYGASINEETLHWLFPFFPQKPPII
jgi:LmbE family N-acetylglucosaminyl deacetylase